MRVTPLLAAALAIGFGLGCGGAQSTEPGTRGAPDSDGVLDESPLGLIWKGPADAPVHIVEFADFECGYCAKVQPTLQRLFEAFPGKVRLTIVHTPLAFHKRARPASLASLAAARQGRFWQMHDRLFAAHTELSDAAFKAHASALELDLPRFTEDLADPKLEADIERHMGIGRAIGVDSTPTFYVNGTELPGAVPYAWFEALVRDEIRRAKGTPGFARARTAAAFPALARVAYPGPHAAPPSDEAAAAKPRPERYKIAIHADDPSKGPTDALVTIVEFADFECPYCAVVAPVVERVRADRPEDVRVVFKHMPLRNHRFALVAAAISLCAADQDAFWPIHDALFAHDWRQGLSPESFAAMAQGAKIDAEKVGACLEQGGHRDTLLRHMDDAHHAEVQGTPTLFVNGRPVRGAADESTLGDLVDAELERARAKVSGGTAKADVYAATVADGAVNPPFSETTHDFDRAGLDLRGPGDAKARVTVFSAFGCRFCDAFSAELGELSERLGDRVSIAFKAFPTPGDAPGMQALRAAFCAGEQGRFWAVHDRLAPVATADLPIAVSGLSSDSELALDKGRYDACVAGEGVDDLIARDVAEALRAGVYGGPTVFVNGREYVLEHRYDAAGIAAAIENFILN